MCTRPTAKLYSCHTPATTHTHICLHTHCVRLQTRTFTQVMQLMFAQSSVAAEQMKHISSLRNKQLQLMIMQFSNIALFAKVLLDLKPKKCI